MRPKEYYDKNTIHEDAKYVFTLMPSEFETEYNQYIKDPIESIGSETEKITCESYLDFKPSTDHLDEIWRSIQQASIVIANITGFKPSVMLELGVALIKKEKVILIAEKQEDEKLYLPFNISTLGIEFYEADKLETFSKWLIKEISKMVNIEEDPLKDPQNIKLMHTIRKHRRNGDFDTVFILFKEMDKNEPNNWYIYMEWGITYENLKNYEEAISRLNKALEIATIDRQKSEIYTALGVVYRKHEKTKMALTSFQKAENLDSDSAVLYDKWAFLYYTMGNFQEAMNKMTSAINRDNNNEDYGLKLEYYSKRFANKSYRKTLKEFMDEKKGKIKEPPKDPNPEPPRPRPSRDKINFENFTRKYSAKNRDVVEGIINNVVSHIGVFVQFEEGVSGLIYRKKLPPNFDVGNRYRVGDRIRAKVVFYDYDQQRIQLELADSHR